jgi:3',5'-cyclic AMP phosphodiesterase CpdA
MMSDEKPRLIKGEMNRREALECMAWCGTGVIWALVGGIPKAFAMETVLKAGNKAVGSALSGFSFMQISDSHIGFNKDANHDTPGTLQAAIGKITASISKPSFLIHTGDITHLSKAEEFDTADQIIRGSGMTTHYVPGEHDMVDGDSGRLYMERYGQGTKGAGWYSFDDHGVHFIGLVNVVNLKAGGLGNLGAEQLAWLKDDLAGLSASTPIVVFAHIPLWMVYAEWGWGTDDAAVALSYLKRFGSVTVLNGHIHQLMQKVEGNVQFHTARSTAFLQPRPGQAKGPGPIKAPGGRLKEYLGITSVEVRPKDSILAITDETLT